MKALMFLVCFIFSINALAGDTTAYQNYKKESSSFDHAIAQSYKDYFKHDSLTKAWDKKTEIPEEIASIIQENDAKDSIQLEEKRVALVAKYKIKEAIAALADQARKNLNLASAY